MGSTNQEEDDECIIRGDIDVRFEVLSKQDNRLQAPVITCGSTSRVGEPEKVNASRCDGQLAVLFDEDPIVALGLTALTHR